MKIVLLESLEISQEKLERLVAPLLEQGHTFESYHRTEDPQELIRRGQGAQAILLANMPLSGEVIRQWKDLRFLDIAFTGVDHVDLEAAKEAGIRVSNAAGYSTRSVAETAVFMMLSLLRNMSAMEERCRQGGTKAGLLGTELGGKTVGIVGAGAIGMETARICKAFGCRILAYRRHPQPTEGVEFVSLEELLQASDIVSLHCPSNRETYHLMNEERIRQMKPGALLINTARGAVVDTQALANALHSGALAGAGVDVFETEPPLPPEHPLLHTPNTLLTPHMAFASRESMERRAEIVFSNLRAFLEGRMENVVL